MTLSANRLILWHLPVTGMPFLNGETLMAGLKGSITNVKIKGGKGHSCLVSFVMLKESESTEVVKTCAYGLMYNAKIAGRIKPLNPNLVQVACRYPQCTQSEAFSASRAGEAVGSLRLSANQSKFKILQVPSGA